MTAILCEKLSLSSAFFRMFLGFSGCKPSFYAILFLGLGVFIPIRANSQSLISANSLLKNIMPTRLFHKADPVHKLLTDEAESIVGLLIASKKFRYQMKVTCMENRSNSGMGTGMGDRVDNREIITGEDGKLYLPDDRAFSPYEVSHFEGDDSLADELTKIKKQLDSNAHKFAQRSLWIYFVVLTCVWIVLALLTYRLSWGIMEPWTYFIGGTVTLGSYLYFAVTKREISPVTIYNQIVESRKQKNYRDSGFDVVKYEQLINTKR